MKRYWLFAGYNGKDKASGMYSFVKDFSTVKQAKEYCDFDYKECKFDWGQIFDTEHRIMVYEGDFQKGWVIKDIGLSQIKQKND